MIISEDIQDRLALANIENALIDFEDAMIEADRQAGEPALQPDQPSDDDFEGVNDNEEFEPLQPLSATAKAELERLFGSVPF